MRELSHMELLSVNGGAGLPDPGTLLSGLITDVTKTATDALGDVLTTVNDVVANLGLGSLGLGGLGGLGLGGL